MSQIASAYNKFLSGEKTFVVVGEGEYPIYGEFGSAFPWEILPGSQIRAGLSGRVRVTGANPVSLRVHVGAATSSDNMSPVVGGLVAYEVTLPAGVTVDVGGIGEPVEKPSGSRAFTKMQVTAAAVSGPSSFEFTALVATVVPVGGGGQGLFMQGNDASIFAFPAEKIAHEWLVDFDHFEGAAQVLAGIAGQLDGGAGGVMRLRVGGTVGAGVGSEDPDGDVVAEWVNTGGLEPEPFTRNMGGTVAPFANIYHGVKPVKFTLAGCAGSYFAAALREAT